MDLPGLDLNLLVALHALLAERNVTRAGERIGLSQPATSAALARLRRHFGDELLERVGSQYQLTPMAMALLEQSGVALRYVEQTFAARPLFDAVESDREFIVLASDYALTVLGGAIAGLLEQRAPDVRLRFRAFDSRVVDRAETAMRSYDALLLPHGYLEDLPNKTLFQDDWVAVAAGRPAPLRTLTQAELRDARWVVIYDQPTQFTPADKTLRLLGHDRRVDIVAEYFGAVPAFVAGSDRLGLLPRRMAERFAGTGEVDILELPVELPHLVEKVWWHPTHGADPGHRWLIQLITDAAALIAPSPSDAAIEPPVADVPDGVAHAVH